MSSLIPGVHVAIHTRAEILHTAAWLDFSNYVRSLLRLGRLVEARTLWESVVEVIHNGTNPNVEVLGIPELPGILRMPCMESPCVRCDTRRGGFKFPFVGIWTRTAVLAQMGDSAQLLWERYHGSEETFELLALQRLVSGVTRDQLVPSHVGRALSRFAPGRDGFTLQEFFELWRAWQVGSYLWREPWMGYRQLLRANSDQLRAGAALRVVLGAVEVGEAWIPGPCRLCWMPSFTTCPGCGGDVCEDCRRGADLCPFCGESDDSMC